MQFDRAKLKAVILYACSQCERSRLGAVKLHKVLYFADMLHYAEVGAPITGSTYRKRPLGPTCDALLPALRDLVRSDSLRIEEVDYFGYRKKEYIPLESPDMSRLSDTEVALLDEVIAFVCFGNTAKTISDYSHNRAWEIAEYGAVLPYHSVFSLFPIQVSLETMEWAEEESEAIEAERQKEGALGHQDFSAFRNRLLQEIRR